MPALENIALWHERDISHSSVERNIGPDTTITLDFAIKRTNKRYKGFACLSRKYEKEYGKI